MRPVLFHLSSVPVHSYGLVVSSAMTAGAWWFVRRCAARGLGERRARLSLLAALPAGLAGAKLLYVAFHWPPPASLAAFFRDGYGSTGGLAAACAAARLLWRGPRVLEAADAAAVPLAFSYAAAKGGCLLAGCCYGRPELGPVPLQAVFMLAFAALGAALLCFEREPRVPGELFFTFAFWYCALRLPLDGLRGDLPAQAHGVLATLGVSSLLLAALLGRRLFRRPEVS